jgi:hypothetical protein
MRCTCPYASKWFVKRYPFVDDVIAVPPIIVYAPANVIPR